MLEGIIAMQRVTTRHITQSRRSSARVRSTVRTKISFALLGVSTLLGTGLIVAPVAYLT
ncbi:MAG: hypothetical protein ACRDT8_04050 [Micromonosporaceae bacterium]